MKSLVLKSKNMKTFLDFISRVAITSIFISDIPAKVSGFAKTVDFISSKGIPSSIASVLLVGAIICLLLGSGFFIFGGNQKVGAAFLLIFLIPTTLIFHVFPLNQRALLMNLGLMGGLLISALRDPK